jgi:hypothetical protein
MPCPLWVTCGRRHGKSFFDVSAALVGCGHVSGLLMRRVWPLALGQQDGYVRDPYPAPRNQRGHNNSK